MDYSKTTIAKRTRLQHDLLYKKFNEEKKAARSRGSNSGVNVARVEGFGGSSDCSSVNPGQGPSVTSKINDDYGEGESSKRKQLLNKIQNGVASESDFCKGGKFDTNKTMISRKPVIRSDITSVVGTGVCSGEESSRRNPVMKLKPIMNMNGAEDNSGEDESSGRSKIAKSGKPITMCGSVCVGKGDMSGKCMIAKLKQKFCRNEKGVGIEDASCKGKSYGSCLKGKSLLGKSLKKDENMGSRIGIVDEGKDCETSGDDVVILSDTEVGIEDESLWRSNIVKSSKGLRKNECGVGINKGSMKIKKTMIKGFENKKDVGSLDASLIAKSPLGESLKKDENVVGVGGIDDCVSGDDDVIFLGESVTSNGSGAKLGSGLGSGSGSGDEFVSSRIAMSWSDEERVNEVKESVSAEARSPVEILVESEEVIENQDSDLEDSVSESSSDGDTSDPDDMDFGVDGSSSSSEDYDEEYVKDRNGNKIEDDEECSFVEKQTINRKEIMDWIEVGGKDDKQGVGKSATNKQKNRDEKEKATCIEDGLKRKRAYGLDILIDREKEEVAEHRDPATRLSPRSFSKSREKRLKLGGVSRPVPVEEYEALNSSSGSDGDGHYCCDHSRIRKIDGKQEVKSGKSTVEMNAHPENAHILARSLFKSGVKKLKLGGVSRPVPVEEYEELNSSSESDNDGHDAFDNSGVRKLDGKQDVKSGKSTSERHARPENKRSSWDMEDKFLAPYVRPQGEPPAEGTLPYKFRFEEDDEIAKLPVKSECDIEVDALFAEMDMVSTLSEIGSLISSAGDMKGDYDNPKNETDQATLCLRGKHELFLHEPYGIMCKFCSHVDLEMKHILPPLVMNTYERRDRYHHDNAYNSCLSDFQLQDADCEGPYGSNGMNNEKGTVWDLVPGVIPMNLHQREGFEFIWKSIAGGLHIEKLEKPLPDGGSGCIISHAPGTGKTRLTIVFLLTFMKLYPEARPVVIAPRGVLRTWEDEVTTWSSDIPFHNLNMPEFSGWENSQALNHQKFARNGGLTTNAIRRRKLTFWKKKSSILGISYKLFEQLAGRGGKRRRSRNNPEDEKIRNLLLQRPSLLVLDEGHIPRTKESLIYQALSKVRTQRRIILSGTPFQNNFEELFNIFWFVNPKFAESISFKDCDNFGKRRGRKSSAEKEKWAALTSSIGKHHNSKLRELRAMINPFVHVHKGSILQEKLPGLRDALVVLRPTVMQKTLLESIKGQRSFLKEEFLMSLISVHPSLLPENIAEKEEFSALRSDLKRVEKNPYAGVKTKFLIELIRICEQSNEKVLVFSKFIDPLNFVMELLETHFNWIEGREVLHMDGKMDEKNRHSLIDSFNDPNSEVKVLLASIKACNEGINLVGASRVVLLDVNWNPSVEQQAISRAYRLGQKKVVHVYHLVTGTMEGEKYVRQFEKALLSKLVFCCKSQNSFKPEILTTVSEDKILEGMVQHEKLRDMFEKVIYQPKELDLSQTSDFLDL